MKKKTFGKPLALILVIALALGAMTGCGGSDGSGGTDEGSPSAYTIGVIQLVEHPALDAAYQGFMNALADNGYHDGTEVTFDFQNAQADINNLSTIGDRFVSHKVDMILAITTDATQAVAGKTTEIPILATAVTSYTTEGLIDSDEAPGGNITGTSDMNPVAAQVNLIVELVPDVETIGLIYNSSEKNSIVQINLAKAEIEKAGLKWQEVTVTNANDVQQAMQSLVTKCEAVYIPTDNTLASSMATVHSVAGEAKIPTVCGESNMVLGGGLATMGIDYYSLGYKTGLMAIEVIKGADPASMPIQYADKSDEVTINGQVADEIGFIVPEKYLDSVIYPNEEE